MWTCPSCMAIFRLLCPQARRRRRRRSFAAQAQELNRHSQPRTVTFRSCIPLFAAVTLSAAAGDGNGLVELVLPDVCPARLLSRRQPMDAKEPQNDQCDAEYAFAGAMISLWKGARA